MIEIYSYFEKEYQQKKASNENGWQNEAGDKEFINWLRELLSEIPPKGNHVLDIGCGAGNISVWLASLGFNVTGIDISSTAIHWAGERLKSLNLSGELICMDFSKKVNFEKNIYDFVIDGLCLHCIIGKDRANFLSNIGQTLKSNGLFYCVTMCGNPKPEILARNFDEKTRYTVYDGIPTRYIGLPNDILFELESSNFTVLWHRIIKSGDMNEQDMLLSINKINK
jgi:2-polyprenyl-3-methyl-5-hydroxy-6-metoxy-1,4-benzoquinol methylase